MESSSNSQKRELKEELKEELREELKEHKRKLVDIHDAVEQLHQMSRLVIHVLNV